MAKTKKGKKKEKVTITTETNEIKELTKIIVSILLIFLLFFTITYLLTKKEDKLPPLEEELEIQYDEILIGELLNKKENEYYVLVTKEDDHFVDLYKAYLQEYEDREKAIRVYYSNLDNVFNQKYQANESKLSISDIKNIRFKGTTLLKIKKGKIVSYYETKDKIMEHLKALID
ncbi:MAG: hypothetical protein GX247_05605 [Mollicutes bacterium]|nr:hypothetical protein [Mollicutes bacterium]